MKQRGRKSAAALAIAQSASDVLETHARPDAPYELTDDEANIWRSVIDRMPSDWFGPETYPLLTQYCRHVVRSHRIAQLVQSMESDPEKSEDKEGIPFWLEGYDRLLKMQERESRAITTLATKMRLAQQSTIAPDAKKERRIGMKRPWDAQS